MANSKDINSTERLLKVIRGSQTPSSNAAEAQNISTKQNKKNSDKFSVHFPKLLAGKRHVQVGVDIGRDDICLAKMTRTSDGRPLLVDQKIIKLDHRIPADSDDFREFLKSSLTAFAGSLNDCEIWAMMNAADVNVHYLKIPIVPKNQMENVIYWTAKKENPIDEKDFIFDYEIQGQVTDQGIPKYSVMVYSAPKAEVEKVRATFSSIGADLTGVTIAPFAIQNIFRTKWLTVGETTFASLYIGNDFSRIDIFNKSNLVMTRGIKTGISSMMEAVDESMSDMLPDRRLDKASIEKMLNEVALDPGKLLQDENGIHWNENSILEMITPALERLTRQIERTLEYYEKSVGYEKVEKLYVSSVLNAFVHPVLHYLGEQLGTRSELFDPFQGKIVAASGMSLSISERSALVPAIGLALSDQKHTPNAVFTYVEKNKEITRKRIGRGIFAVFAAALAVCLVFLVSQAIEYRQLGVKQKKLEQELSRFHPILSKEKVTALAENLKLRHQKNQQYSGRYKGMAFISELSALTPENIRLVNVQITLPVQGGQGQKTEEVVIEGVVLGDRSALDAALAQYVMKLKNSPVFKGAALQKSHIANYKKKEILQFTINVKTG